jgi:hypothetical protein
MIADTYVHLVPAATDFFCWLLNKDMYISARIYLHVKIELTVVVLLSSTCWKCLQGESLQHSNRRLAAACWRMGRVV